MSYLAQGKFGLLEGATAIVVVEKDKPILVIRIPGPVALSWGMWEVPEAANDE